MYKDALDWLNDADKALYTAKHKGRNTISVALSRAAADNAGAKKVIQNYKNYFLVQVYEVLYK